jgi:alpha-1,2-mannosyltransferase
MTFLDRLLPGMSRPARLAALLGAVFFITIAGWLSWHVIQTAHQSFGFDFTSYYRAGGRVLDGLDPYGPSMLAGPVDAKGFGPYRYPPPLALMVAPLARLPFDVAAWIWLAFSLICLAAVVLLDRRISARPLHPLAFVVGLTLFAPFWDGLIEGNVSLMLALMYAFVLYGLVRQRAGLAGFGLAVGALVKLHPALLGLWLLVRGERRAVVATIIAGLALVGVSLLSPPLREGWLLYPTVLRNIFEGSPVYALNGAPTAVLAGLAPLSSEALRLVQIVLILAGVGLTIWAARRSLRGGFAAVSVLSLVLAPVMWPHYLLTLTPAFLALWGAPEASPRRRLGLAIAFALGALGMLHGLAAMLGAFMLLAVAVGWPVEAKSRESASGQVVAGSQ